MRNERRTLRRRWQFDFGAPIASRCVKGLVDLVNELNELEVQKVHFQSITDGIDHKRDEETKGQSLLNGGEFFAETSRGNLPLLGVMHYHPHSRFQPNNSTQQIHADTSFAQMTSPRRKHSLHAYQLSKRGFAARDVRSRPMGRARRADQHDQPRHIIMTPLAKAELTGPRGARLPAHDRGLPGCNRSIFKLVSFSRNVVLRGPFNPHLIWF
jgi:hypothetical protein